MDDLRRGFAAAVEGWDARGWPRPEVVVVAGSGLGTELGAPTHGPIGLGEVLPFPVLAVPGHSHQVEMLAPLPGHPVVYFRGRLHAYQGYDPAEVVFPVRLAAALGARALVLTNAAGGVGRAQRPGQLVLLTDQLNLTGLNPLRGEMPPEWGPRFPDMVGAYDPGLRELAHDKARELGIELAEGVYAGIPGPTYETPAEARMFRELGADVVGMSTVLEVIAARHRGLRCLGISLVTNLSAVAGLDHEEVLAAGRAAAAKIRRLLEALLADSRFYLA